jgi:hypothetical protein
MNVRVGLRDEKRTSESVRFDSETDQAHHYKVGESASLATHPRQLQKNQPGMSKDDQGEVRPHTSNNIAAAMRTSANALEIDHS